MPITGPSSYLSTTDEFIAHWTAVNALLAPLPANLILEGNRTLATLTGLRTSLAAARADVEVKRNGYEFARADAVLKRIALLGRAQQVMDAVRANWSGTAFPALLPEKLSPTAAGARIEQMLDDVADVWVRLNAATPPAGVTVPLTLTTDPTPAVPAPPAYLLATFQIELSGLKVAHTALENAAVPLRSARASRDALQDQIRPMLVDYRVAVPTKLPPSSPLIDSIPRYSPEGGATPEPADATGSWNVAAGKAFIDFTPSPSASVVRHELRYVAGPDYDAEDEEIAGSINAGSPSHFETLAGLPIPGVTASYRVYAITADGNERTSNTVTVTRPA